MKINILSGCVLAASMLLTTSCSDFLTEDPKGQLTNETLFKTKADLDLAVNSLYSNIQGFQCNSNTMLVVGNGEEVLDAEAETDVSKLSHALRQLISQCDVLAAEVVGVLHPLRRSTDVVVVGNCRVRHCLADLAEEVSVGEHT